MGAQQAAGRRWGIMVIPYRASLIVLSALQSYLYGGKRNKQKKGYPATRRRAYLTNGILARRWKLVLLLAEQRGGKEIIGNGHQNTSTVACDTSDENFASGGLFYDSRQFSRVARPWPCTRAAGGAQQAVIVSMQCLR